MAAIRLEQSPSLSAERLRPLLVVIGLGYANAERHWVRAVRSNFWNRPFAARCAGIVMIQLPHALWPEAMSGGRAGHPAPNPGMRRAILVVQEH